MLSALGNVPDLVTKLNSVYRLPTIAKYDPIASFYCLLDKVCINIHIDIMAITNYLVDFNLRCVFQSYKTYSYREGKISGV